MGVNHQFLRETLEDVYDYDLNSRLALTRLNVSTNGLDHCIMVNWTGMVSYDNPLMDCFNISGNASWYSGYETYNQIWPMNRDARPRNPFVPSDYLFLQPSPAAFGPILHPVWMSSSGLVVFVDKEVPLHVSINDSSTNTTGEVCLHAAPHSLRCQPNSLASTTLRYTICAFEDLPTAAKFFLNESSSVEHTNGPHPDMDVFLHPIWSTWATFKKDINDEKILGFASNITSHGFNISQLEIDDMFSTKYGDLNFNTTKFPDYQDFRNKLSAITPVNVTAWVMPFIDPQAEVARNAVLSNRVLPYQDAAQGRSISLVFWWNGYGAVVNLLDSNTRSWMNTRLNTFLSSYDLIALKFDAGEETYLPKCVPSVDPIRYVMDYNQFVGNQSYTPRSEMRAAYFGQRQPLLYRMLDRTSSWGLENGLHSVLTSTLSLGIAGYPFILPDMIGGNLYNSNTVSEELYIRWLQLSAFLPAMQFSIPPWYSGNDTIIDLARKMTSLHTVIVRDYMIPLIQEAAITGYPIVRPLWWIDTSPAAFSTDDEFLIGDSLLVAPILVESLRSRAVYFPNGCWQCLSSTCSSNPPYRQGSYTLDVPLQHILYFRLVQCPSS